MGSKKNETYPPTIREVKKRLHGTAKSFEIMRKGAWDLPLLADLGSAMSDASICGLGQAAPNPVRCVQKFFPEEL